MNINYIIELINQGENSSVEFKRSDVKLDSLCKEIIAFSNSSGGVVLIGVDDDGTILGVESDRNYEEWVVNIARNNIIPPVNIQSREVVWDGKKLWSWRFLKERTDHTKIIAVGSIYALAQLTA